MIPEKSMFIVKHLKFHLLLIAWVTLCWLLLMNVAFSCSLFNAQSSGGSPIETYRRELMDTARRISSTGPLKLLESKIGTEYSQIDYKSFIGARVIYFGSQLDLTRPLVDFPLASDFHFIDPYLITAENIHGEIQNRLKQFSGNAKIKIADEGYTRSISEKALKDIRGKIEPLEFIDPIELGVTPEIAIRRPMVIQLTWRSPSLGNRTVTFYLHPFYYGTKSNPFRANQVMERVGNIVQFFNTWVTPDAPKPAGILNFGSPVPNQTGAIWESLPTGSVILHAAYKPAHKDWPNGSPALPQAHQLLPHKATIWANPIVGNDGHVEAPYILVKE